MKIRCTLYVFIYRQLQKTATDDARRRAGGRSGTISACRHSSQALWSCAGNDRRGGIVCAGGFSFLWQGGLRGAQILLHLCSKLGPDTLKFRAMIGNSMIFSVGLLSNWKGGESSEECFGAVSSGVSRACCAHCRRSRPSQQHQMRQPFSQIWLQ